MQEKLVSWSKQAVFIETKLRWKKIQIELQEKLKELRKDVNAEAEKRKLEKKVIYNIHRNRVQTAQAVDPEFEEAVCTELCKEVEIRLMSNLMLVK